MGLLEVKWDTQWPNGQCAGLGSNGPGLSLGWGTVLCSQARHFTLTVPLFTQVYKWVLVNLWLGGNPAMDQHPIQGRVEILLVISCYWNRDKLRPDGPFDSNADLTMGILNLSVLIALAVLGHLQLILTQWVSL